jgi:hypothetical protein
VVTVSEVWGLHVDIDFKDIDVTPPMTTEVERKFSHLKHVPTLIVGSATGCTATGNLRGDHVVAGAGRAHRAVDFLVQKRFIDPKRIAVVGFALGAWQTVSAVELGVVQCASQHKFRAAAAFYPSCGSFGYHDCSHDDPDWRA